MDFKTLLTVENLLSIVLFIAKPILLLIVARIVIGILLKVVGQVFEKTNLDKGIQSFGKSAIRIALWVLAIIMVAGAFGIDTASLVAVVGVASLALSLSVQNIFTNVFSGITILMSKPFVVGDFIDVAGVSGTVKEINLMRTVLTTGDNKIELVPNGDIAASKITNYSTSENRRVDLKVTASYDDKTNDVKNAIMEVIENDERILKDPAPFIAINSYGANDIEYIVRFWVKNGDYWGTYFDVNEGIRESYEKHNIQFSYPHIVVHSDK